MRGTREEIITGILTTAKAWGQLMTCAEAERLTDRAIRGIRTRRILKWIFWGAVVTVLIAIAVSFGGNP
jgi:t-SNARE complex subunit (syntaxin)